MPGIERIDTYLAACVQFDVRAGEVEANLARVEDGLARAAAAGAALAVLPEMWTTSFVAGYDAELLARARLAEARVAALSAEFDLLIVGGGPSAGDDGRIRNRAHVFDRGAVLGSYAKIHLFSPISEHRYHAAGSEPLVVDTRLGRIGVIVCYDIRFPELVRHLFQAGCEVLAVPSQWPEARADHWRALTKARAIENQFYVVGCNRTGIAHATRPSTDAQVFPGDSRIVDPMGAVIAAGAGESDPVLGEIELRRVRAMRRILPIAKDRRPEVYARLWSTDAYHGEEE